MCVFGICKSQKRKIEKRKRDKNLSGREPMFSANSWLKKPVIPASLLPVREHWLWRFHHFLQNPPSGNNPAVKSHDRRRQMPGVEKQSDADVISIWQSLLRTSASKATLHHRAPKATTLHRLSFPLESLLFRLPLGFPTSLHRGQRACVISSISQNWHKEQRVHLHP